MNFDLSNVRAVDPEIAAAMQGELYRQRSTLELIASENFTSLAVLEATGSVLTNKYAEGYPGKRYYGGCEFVDVAESLAIERAKKLFNAEHANAAALRLTGQCGRVFSGATAGRHDSGNGTGSRRAPHARP